MRWILFFLALVGCAPNYVTKSAFEVRSAVQIEQSAFDPQRTYTGPPVVVRTFGLNRHTITAHLRSWQDPEHPEITAHQLYIAINYSWKWRHYYSANFKGGAGAQFLRIRREVDACDQYVCTFNEDFGITVSHDFLETHRATGFAIQANAQSGDKTVVNIPANYVEGYLAIAGQATSSDLAAKRRQTPRRAAADASRPPDTRESRLLELKRLRSENLITPEEYYEKRAEILGEL